MHPCPPPQVTLGIPDFDAVSLFFFAVFAREGTTAPAPARSVALVKQHVKSLRFLAGASSRAQSRLVGCAERLCAAGAEQLHGRKVFPVLLKALYDQDVIDEAAIRSWAPADSSRRALGSWGCEQYGFSDVPGAVRECLTAANRPFLAWLEQAEEEDTDEEEDEEDEEEN